jgi:copper resistance protein C
MRTLGRCRWSAGKGAVWLAVLCSFLLAPTPALAHSELESSRPADGSRPKEPPEHLVLNFSEPPSKDSVVTVSDPCTKNLVGDSFVAENAFHVQLDGGTGGRYQVSYSLISADDGHPTKGTFSFTVKGAAKCSSGQPDDGPAGPADDPSEAAASEGDPASDEDDSSSPIVPIALGGVGLVAVAALARFATRK